MGDLLLRKPRAKYSYEGKGKLALKWDGSYKVTRVIKANTYHLQDIEETISLMYDIKII